MMSKNHANDRHLFVGDEWPTGMLHGIRFRPLWQALCCGEGVPPSPKSWNRSLGETSSRSHTRLSPLSIQSE